MHFLLSSALLPLPLPPLPACPLLPWGLLLGLYLQKSKELFNVS